VTAGRAESFLDEQTSDQEKLLPAIALTSVIYYLLILASRRIIPKRKTKGYASTISRSINAKIRLSLISHLQAEYYG